MCVGFVLCGLDHLHCGSSVSCLCAAVRRPHCRFKFGPPTHTTLSVPGPTLGDNWFRKKHTPKP